MTANRMATALLVALVAALCVGAKAQSSDCTTVLVSLSPCLDYITGNSTTPSRGCCTQLATVVSSSPQCLCQVLSGGGSSLGLDVNQTQALQLPSACNVQTPSISSCNVGSPAGSPAGSPEGLPGSPTTPAGPGSNSVPGDNGSSAAVSLKLASPISFFLLSIAIYAAAFAVY